MATSKRVYYRVGWYSHYLDVRVISQDVEENETRLGYRYWVRREPSPSNGAWTTLNNTEFTVTIGSVTHSQSPNFDFRDGNDITMMSGQVTVAHDDDGSLTVGLGMTNEQVPDGVGGPSFFNAGSSGAPQNFVVTDIPRASTFTVTPNPVIEGDTVDIEITRASTDFTHTITWVSGVDSGTIGTGVATSDTFEPDPELLDGGTSVAITITVETFDGATSLGTTSVDLILRATPVYPEVGVGTPYDVRLRRVELDGGILVAKEIIPNLEVSITDTLSASPTCTLTTTTDLYETSLDEGVVVADFFDGAQWLGVNLLFYMSRVEDDKADETHAVQYTGLGYADYLLSKNAVEEEREWEDAKPGSILDRYIDLGQDRGWGPHITASFSPTQTTLGTPWQHNTSMTVSVDTPVSQLLDGFVSDVLIEYRSYFDPATGKAIIDAFNPGYGYDWTSRGADPIIDLGKMALYKVADAAPVRKDASEKLTRVRVRGDEASSTREAAQNINPLLGHLEGSVSASGVTKVSKLSQLGDATLLNNATATVERTFSYDLSSTQTSTALFPYRTFRPGDWLLIPGDLGPERNRVSQVAITRNADGITATITVGDLIPSGVAATARKLAQAGGNAIAGGTMRTPLQLSNGIPAAPVLDVPVASGYWDPTGAPKAGVELAWSAVTESVAGNSIDVDLYEVSARDEIGDPWVVKAISDITVVTIAPLEINQTMDLRVRARSVDGVYGVYSDLETIITPEPTVDLDGPGLADLYTDGVGSIYAVWDGELDGLPAPLRLAYVGAEVSDDDGATYVPMGVPITAAGMIVINPNAYGTFLVRLRGYDHLGNAGDASDPQEITTTDPHVDPEIPATPTGLTSTPGAGWDASNFFPTAWFDLEWDAVTLDVDGAAIDIAGYDLWGKRTDETELRFLTSVTGLGARWTVQPGAEWSFQVSATSTHGGVSALSDPYVDLADATITAPAAPSAPVLSQYAGLLNINWSGTGMQPYIKTVYATISTSSGGTYTRVGMPLLGPGTVVVPDLATGVEYFAKIVLVAEDGQTSTSPASAGLVLNPITGVTIQTSEVANTGIKMTSASLTAYNASGDPTFILDASTGEVWIAPYDAVFELGASGEEAETGDPTTGIAISSEGSSFNTFIHPSGVQIRNDQTPLSWWEADSEDASLVNFFSPRAVFTKRIMMPGKYEGVEEEKTTGTRLVFRYKGA